MNLKTKNQEEENWGRVIGIFLQDQFAIVASMPAADMKFEQLETDDKLYKKITISPEVEDLAPFIKKALDEGLQLHSDTNITSVCIASPGPIRNSGTEPITKEDYIYEDDYGLIQSSYRWRKIFSNANLKKIFDGAKADIQNKLLGEAVFIVVHDAEAIAYGSYHARKERGKIQSSDDVEVHVTVSEGIGGAIIENSGRLQKGKMHSEMGHILVRRHEKDRDREDFLCESQHCVTDCLEQMASLIALNKRFSDKNEDGYSKFKKWRLADLGGSGTPKIDIDLIAYYLAQLCVQLIVMIAPTRIVFSGYPAENEEFITYLAEKTRAMLRIKDADEQHYPGYESQNNYHALITSDPPNKALLYGVYGCCRYGRIIPPDGVIEGNFGS